MIVRCLQVVSMGKLAAWCDANWGFERQAYFLTSQTIKIWFTQTRGFLLQDWDHPFCMQRDPQSHVCLSQL